MVFTGLERVEIFRLVGIRNDRGVLYGLPKLSIANIRNQKWSRIVGKANRVNVIKHKEEDA